MSAYKREGLEKLRSQVEVAMDKADACTLYDTELPELIRTYEKRLGDVGDLKLGDNINGWKNPYPVSDPRSMLLEYQFQGLHDASRFKLDIQSRQTGKDFEMEGEAVVDCLARKTDWMIAAPSERQALDSLDQAKLWAQGFDMHIADILEEREGNHSQTLLKSSEVIFEKGSRIRAVPGKPDTVRGRSANVGMTEADFFENPNLTWRAILPSITNPLRGGEKKVRIKSTPNGKGGLLWKLMNQPDGKAMRWRKRIINIYQAVLMGLPVDIQALKEAMDDPEGFDQECLCLFLDGSNVLLPYDVIALAESFEATEFIGDDFWNAGGTRIVLGIDFGRTNDPTCCWATEEVGGMSITREVCLLKGMNTVDQANELRRRIKRSQRVCLDYTGPGIGLGDMLVKEFGEWNPTKHQYGKIELCTFTAQFTRILFPNLRQAFSAPNNLKIPVSIEIREDLHEMKQVIKNGQYSYKAKRTALGHSDRCTALALNRRAATGLGLGMEAIII